MKAVNETHNLESTQNDTRRGAPAIVPWSLQAHASGPSAARDARVHGPGPGAGPLSREKPVRGRKCGHWQPSSGRTPFHWHHDTSPMGARLPRGLGVLCRAHRRARRHGGSMGVLAGDAPAGCAASDRAICPGSGATELESKSHNQGPRASLARTSAPIGGCLYTQVHPRVPSGSTYASAAVSGTH